MDGVTSIGPEKYEFSVLTRELVDDTRQPDGGALVEGVRVARRHELGDVGDLGVLVHRVVVAPVVVGVVVVLVVLVVPVAHRELAGAAGAAGAAALRLAWKQNREEG